MREYRRQLGPTLVADGVFFRVWAPRATTVAVRRLSPPAETVALAPAGAGYFTGLVAGLEAGALYTYLLDGARELPDPASRCQPQGVHGPSQVVDLASYPWQDKGWRGLARADYIVYELHVGAFSPEGTFAGVGQRLDYLCELGITAVELMPVAQFPGARNWGYDGVYPFAVQGSYGGAAGLQGLVDACHRRGLAVILDVVYNHLGPEGNYTHAYGPYFTNRYQTPWGEAVNFDGPGSDGVREYFIANALFWLEEFHLDALRLDAVHGIFDGSACHILEELSSAVHGFAATRGRQCYLIAESDLNDSRLLRPLSQGGYGLDGQWNDDFHHALHTLLTAERHGYYQDFRGLPHLLTALQAGFVYAGEYSRYRQRRHGNDASDLDPGRFVVYAQNHDQVGNRPAGDRLALSLDLEGRKLVAGTVLLSPYLPLLFMGEEYGETAPFPYFVSHSDSALIAAVRRGRQAEFAACAWGGAGPDPQAESTYLGSRIDLERRRQGEQALLYRFTRRLLALRKNNPALGVVRRQDCTVRQVGAAPVLVLARKSGACRSLLVLNFGHDPKAVELPAPGGWRLCLDSSGREWGGCTLPWSPIGGATEGPVYPSNPRSVAVFLADR